MLGEIDFNVFSYGSQGGAPLSYLGSVWSGVFYGLDRCFYNCDSDQYSCMPVALLFEWVFLFVPLGFCFPFVIKLKEVVLHLAPRACCSVAYSGTCHDVCGYSRCSLPFVAFGI